MHGVSLSKAYESIESIHSLLVLLQCKLKELQMDTDWLTSMILC